MPDNLPPDITDSCLYECNGTEYVLVGGSAPEGYYCRDVLGPCDIDDVGEELTEVPVLIPVVPPTPIDPALSALRTPDAASYRYEPQTDEFYFAAGDSAKEGFRYFGKIKLADLKKALPLVGAAAEAKKLANPNKGFTIEIPAVGK